MSSLGSLLTALAEERGWTRRWREQKALAAAAQVLDPLLGTHGRAADVRAGILVVEVDHPVWGTEVLLHKRVFVERINALLGGDVLTDVRVRRARPVRPCAGARGARERG